MSFRVTVDRDALVRQEPCSGGLEWFDSLGVTSIEWSHLTQVWLATSEGNLCVLWAQERNLLPGFNLRGADLRDVDLHGANLECANLEGANTDGAIGLETKS